MSTRKLPPVHASGASAAKLDDGDVELVILLTTGTPKPYRIGPVAARTLRAMLGDALAEPEPANVREAAIEAIAERLDDPLTMLGVDPDGRDQGDDLSGHADYTQEPVKRTLARAALEGLEAHRAAVSRETGSEHFDEWGLTPERVRRRMTALTERLQSHADALIAAERYILAAPMAQGQRDVLDTMRRARVAPHEEAHA